MNKIIIIEQAKELLEEWSKVYQYIPIRYESISATFDNLEISFTEKGFICKDLQTDIEYYLSEMTIYQATVGVRLLPELQYKINKINGKTINW